jgi:1,4-alpha-glucan branching enzyme
MTVTSVSAGVASVASGPFDESRYTMIKRSRGDAVTKVTFALAFDECDQPVSVVGDFNGWDPFVHPMKKRSNGTRSVSIELETGRSYRFMYLTDDGSWLNDPDADTVANDHAGVDSLLSA